VSDILEAVESLSVKEVRALASRPNGLTVEEVEEMQRYEPTINRVRNHGECEYNRADLKPAPLGPCLMRSDVLARLTSTDKEVEG